MVTNMRVVWVRSQRGGTVTSHPPPPPNSNGGSTDRPTDTATQEQVPNEITIRGRKISELMAKLSEKKHQTPQHAKNKTPSRKTRTKQTPTPSSVQKNKLTNHLMNKNKQEQE